MGDLVLEALILRWGYIVLGIGTLLEGETIVVVAGAMAHRGLLSLPLVMVVAALGAFAGDLLWYGVGRTYGHPFLQRRKSLAERMNVLQKALDRYGALFVFMFRFIYGIRTVSPLFLGVMKYPFSKYLLLNVIGVIVWSILFTYIGWGAAATLKAVLQRHPHVEEVVVFIVVMSLIWLLAGKWLRGRARPVWWFGRKKRFIGKR